ncbi:hypothetical protein CWI42_110270 [Ordospora colligata]|uniref:Uncharacterized protein n=1 Tax=Ordospora colligata OC4 TaxID=1354746 RepID=A0A0B2UI22_9MICR|nr:uncharacterized protein M896_110270 [Ordospora colligata OC4]KHN68998.1 hypothetical protein M896_110270 [Ordospora colligata OC4]TBU14226.1 hypothetical protein CWI40_110270 [Ordospora colligata]TBU14273.1 hypothetical protein CWI41_110270 [Ordospora colligata]TBU17903.1 hypothetical protein CWI42_110270 [Ordospora colligata]
MGHDEQVRMIAEEVKCSYDVARNAYVEANGDIERAVQIAKKKGNVLYSGGNSGLYVEEKPSGRTITQYKNGVLVNNKFYNFSIDNNIRLKQMLSDGEFDASLLNAQGDTAEVIYQERLNEEYCELPKNASVTGMERKPGSSFIGEGRRLGNSKK